jgi:hypothetical protein
MRPGWGEGMVRRLPPVEEPGAATATPVSLPADRPLPIYPSSGL